MSDQDDDSSHEAEPPATQGSTRPTAKFSGPGGINAAVWKHKSESGPSHYSVRIDRTYKNNEGQLVSTAYLREGDLLRAQKILDQVDDWIELDRAKGRSGGGEDVGAGRS